MSRILERKKQRWEYLRKKGTTYLKGGLAILFALFFAGIACWQYRYFKYLLLSDPEEFGEAIGYVKYAILLVIALALCSAAAAWQFLRSAGQANSEARQLPYVPPITPATLTQEEVLLRSSDVAPQNLSQYLLRGAHNTEAVDGQELLRGVLGSEE